MRVVACLVFAVIFFNSCATRKTIQVPKRVSQFSGTAFYKSAAAFNWKQRDSAIISEVLLGDVPAFLKHFVAIKVILDDSLSAKRHRAKFYVAPDYLLIGTDKDWARVNITPMAAQRIADTLHCFLPTHKIVDDIYKAAKVKLEPVPMYALRDSTPTMYHHHLIIEGQRKGRKGLIAGILKDVVISSKVAKDPRSNRVAIYGWHQLDGKAIQPLYSGHVNWYVDYSHGIRLIYRKIMVDDHWMDYTDVLKDPVLKNLLCDEEDCSFYRYPY